MHFILFAVILYFYYWYFVSYCEPSECFALKIDSVLRGSCVGSSES
jgi:hypothetical protein